MVKNIDKTEDLKKIDKKDHPCKGKKIDIKDHTEKYKKNYEKDHFPRKIWPTDSEDSKHKGPKI